MLELRINLTPSMPVGLYRLTSEIPAKDGLVMLCVPESWKILAKQRGYSGAGSCPDGSMPLLKRLVAMPGDRIDIHVDGISVNGRLQSDSRACMRDSKGREMFPDLRSGTVPPGRALVLGMAGNSFDSRYFGLAPLSGLRSVRALLTVNTKGEKK